LTKNKTYKKIKLGANAYSVSGSENRKCTVVNNESQRSVNYRHYSGTYEISMSYSRKLSMHRSYSGRTENDAGFSASGSRN
jgi:hypothetical protein